MNMGCIFIFGQILIVLAILSLVLYLLRNTCDEMLKKASEKLNRKLYWNFIFRIFIELSLELSIIALLDLKVHNWTDSSWGYIFSSTMAIVSLGILMAIVGFLRFWVKPNYEKIKETSMMQKIGSLYSGLNLKSKANALSFTEWFIVRRVAYSAAVLFAQSQAWL